MTNLTGFESSFFEVRQDDDIAVLKMTREHLTEEENLEQLDQEFNSLIDTFQVRRIILDMSSVGYLTSSAIGKLITVHRRLARQLGQLVLCSLRSEVAEILDTSHLLRYFHVSPSPDTAREQFN